MATFQAGERVADKFRIERVLGEGGMGVVYLAEHEVLGERFAIKVLRAEVAGSAEAATRFVNEARAAIRVKNEHVAAVMDVGRLADGGAYMVMEYLQGADLASVLAEKGQLAVGDAVDYVLQALEGIACAHAEGIIHRDLKPANLFLTRTRGGEPLVKVLDFGISKLAQQQLAQAEQAGITSTQAMLGSPGYMSPEQVRSSRSVDARTDLWAVGVILYRLLTGKAPFDSETLGGVLAAILEDPPEPIRSVRADVPEVLAEVIGRCLMKERNARWPDAFALAEALAPFTPEGPARADRVRRALGVAPRVNAEPPKSAPSAAEPLLEGASAPPLAQPVAAETVNETRERPTREEEAPTLPSEAPSRARPPEQVAEIVQPAPPASWRGSVVAIGALVGVGLVGYLVASSGRAPSPPASQAASPDPSAAAATGTTSAIGGDASAAAPAEASGEAPTPQVRRRRDPGIEIAGPAASRAIALRQAQCDNGQLSDCLYLAPYYAQGKVVAKDPKRAAQLLGRACDGREISACSDLGAMLLRGADGVPKDSARGFKLVMDACDADDGFGCTEAGEAYRRGAGIPADPKRGLSLLDKACSLSDARGCEKLGKAYEHGESVTIDLARAVHYFDIGCQLDYATACSSFGWKLANGQGIKADRNRGIALLRKSCREHARACEHLAELGLVP